MITIFSTPKPFSGHNEIIQRNALQSWKRLHQDIEILLFGDDEGRPRSVLNWDCTMSLPSIVRRMAPRV